MKIWFTPSFGTISPEHLSAVINPCH